MLSLPVIELKKNSVGFIPLNSEDLIKPLASGFKSPFLKKLNVLSLKPKPIRLLHKDCCPTQHPIWPIFNRLPFFIGYAIRLAIEERFRYGEKLLLINNGIRELY